MAVGGTSAPSASAVERGLKSVILSPGPLSSAHAEHENDCDACHSGLDKQAQDDLCLDCHEAVAGDRSNGTGMHGRLPGGTAGRCTTCHTEHRGPDFVDQALDPDTFDHTLADFPLSGGHRDVECAGCHAPGDKYRDAPAECVSCHEQDSPHGDALGEDCGGCHTPRGWQEGGKFDHGATRFALRGAHDELACGACHAGERYTFESLDCVSCHRVRDVHLGVFGAQCESCHSEASWNETRFDHSVETGFTLRGAHAGQECAACHHSGASALPEDPACVTCHEGVDVHAGRHGDDCAACHSEQGWDTGAFDHAREAGWALPGGHGELSCRQCHHGDLTDELDATCRGCHRADDIHGKEQPDDCALCHSPVQWRGTPGFDHELTRFPLEGMHGLAPCLACHRDHRFAQAPGACNDCHAVDDAHDGKLGGECASCHTPNGWALWRFDHGQETGFKLEGVHADVACAGCHRLAGDSPPTTCGGCHAADDRHNGEFGLQCDHCHKGTTFGDITW